MIPWVIRRLPAALRRMSWSCLAPLLAVAAMGATGCASRQTVTVDFSEARRAYLPTDYEAVYTRWTRHEYVLRDADKALEVWATLKSWDFREAYVERYASVYALTAADRETLRKGQLDSLHKYYELHVTAQSGDLKWNDLDKANTAWRVALIDALGHELSSEPVKLQRLPDAYERSFFPAKNAFTKTYNIRFIAPADSDFVGAKSGSLMLRFTSPVGRIEVIWKS
jgi:hypothetical protein